MVNPPKPLCFSLLMIVLIKSILPLQHYDNYSCNSEAQYPGSNYPCSSKKSSCETFIVYRAQENYHTLASISSLFNTSMSQLLLHMSQTDPNNLHPGREIIVPVICSSPGRFSEVTYLYNASKSNSLSALACEVFEGLLKAQSLLEDNPDFGGDDHEFSVIQVPVRCASPDASDIGNGTNFLVTYPVTTADNVYRVARKFGVLEKMIVSANKLDHSATIFPRTTLLIPTKDAPVLNLEHYCTTPNYVHQNINSKSILITADWRAKISGFRCAMSLSNENRHNQRKDVVVRAKNVYMAPEYWNSGQVSIKMDIYALGIVLRELLSGKEAAANGIALKDFLKILGTQDSTGSLETLKMFIDPVLENDYSQGGAMCLALLAKGCAEEDPLRRPSMNNVSITLLRNL